MAKQIIFSESISINYLQDPNLKKHLIESFEINKNNNSLKNIKSNVGGFHTDNLLNNNIISLLKPHLDIYIQDFVSKKFTIELINLWIIENKLNDYNISHLHEQSTFSGVYYLKVPENCGDLVFERNDKSNTMQRYSDFFISTDSVDRMSVKPKENMLLIFPSHLSHYVERNYNKQSRLSASFNFNLK